MGELTTSSAADSSSNSVRFSSSAPNKLPPSEVAATSCGPTTAALSPATSSQSSALAVSPVSVEDQGEGQGRPQQNIRHHHKLYHAKRETRNDDHHSDMDSKSSSNEMLSRDAATVTKEIAVIEGDSQQDSPTSTLLIGKIMPRKQQPVEKMEVAGTPPPASSGERGHVLPNGHWNTDDTKEEEYQMLAVYTVGDLPTEDEEPNRAERSLPRNLYLKPSGVNNEFTGVFSTGYIPVGTRFGPVVGDRWQPDEVPPNTCRKYFWRVSYFIFLENITVDRRFLVSRSMGLWDLIGNIC